MTTSFSILTILTALFTQFVSLPAPVNEDATMAVSCKQEAEGNYNNVAIAVKGNPDFWTAPFVLADIKRGQVTVWGQNTGMPTGDPLEFFVISELSGNDYESLMVSFAKPSDIHQAMEKIGAKAIGPVSSTDHRFWPRGTRVVAEIELQLTGDKAPSRFPIEKTALTQGKEMPFTPWVFTGSPMLPNFEQEGETVYGADLYSPNSIASTFNLQSTVFDLPFQGSKTEMYGTYTRNPEVMAPEAQPMLLHLRLATAEEHDKIIDLKLHFSGPEGTLTVEGPGDSTYPGLSELGADLNTRSTEVDYLQPDFGPDLPLSQVTRLARELQLMENNIPSVRIEPPLKGQLFFKAFVPDPRYRARANRPSQPIELHLRKSGGEKWTATLMELTEDWGDDSRPSIVETQVPLDQPKDFEAYLKDPKKQKSVLFIYTTGNLPHRVLLDWIDPVLSQFPVVFVYLDQD